MKVLVACEVSGVVRDAFRAKGHDAYSSDLQASDSPYHIQGDVREILHKGFTSWKVWYKKEGYDEEVNRL